MDTINRNDRLLSKGEWKEIKAIEEFLKSLKEPMDIRVGDELVTVRPPAKKVTMGLKTTIK